MCLVVYEFDVPGKKMINTVDHMMTAQQSFDHKISTVKVMCKLLLSSYMRHVQWLVRAILIPL